MQITSSTEVLRLLVPDPVEIFAHAQWWESVPSVSLLFTVVILPACQWGHHRPNKIFCNSWLRTSTTNVVSIDHTHMHVPTSLIVCGQPEKLQYHAMLETIWTGLLGFRTKTGLEPLLSRHWWIIHSMLNQLNSWRRLLSQNLLSNIKLILLSYRSNINTPRVQINSCHWPISKRFSKMAKPTLGMVYSLCTHGQSNSWRIGKMADHFKFIIWHSVLLS